jgi:hypothetical protein
MLPNPPGLLLPVAFAGVVESANLPELPWVMMELVMVELVMMELVMMELVMMELVMMEPT